MSQTIKLRNLMKKSTTASVLKKAYMKPSPHPKDFRPIPKIKSNNLVIKRITTKPVSRVSPTTYRPSSPVRRHKQSLNWEVLKLNSAKRKTVSMPECIREIRFSPISRSKDSAADDTLLNLASKLNKHYQ